MSSDPRPVEVVRRFLDASSTLTLACVDVEGPWAADVYFVRSGTELCFFSSPKSRHIKAFTRDPSAAGTVHGVAESWQDIRGVQMSGAVSAVSGVAEKIRVTALYLARFPFVHELMGASGRIPEGTVVLYRFVPESLHWVDNSVGFGHRNPVPW